MLKALLYFFLREKRNILNGKWVLPFRFVSSLLNICFYYFAAKAFIPDHELFKGNSWSLFEYVMVGEITLFFVTDSLIIYAQQTKNIIQQNVLDPLINTKTPFSKCLFMMGVSSYLLSAMTIIFEIMVLALIFKIQYPLINLLKALLLNITFLPLFMALGLMASASLIVLKRGGTLMGTLTGALGILSGAYFPTTVFPEWMSKFLRTINPMQLLLEITREILKDGQLKASFPATLLVSLTVGLILFGISHLCIQKSIAIYRKRGEVLILGGS